SRPVASRAERFGTLPDGRAVHEYALTGDRIEAGILDYGGIVRSVRVPDADGRVAEVALGRPSLEPYLAVHNYAGAIVGRCANRLRDGRFTIDDVDRRVTVNDPPSSVHGGAEGFDRKLWTVSAADDRAVELRLVSPDGDEGFPGEVVVTVRYD